MFSLLLERRVGNSGPRACFITYLILGELSFYLVLFISWLIRPYPISVSMLFLSTYRGVGLMGLNLW